VDVRRTRQEILQVAERHGARNVRVFGSAARGTDRPDSDVDLLVDMEPGRSLLDLVAPGQELEELLDRKVDIVTDSAVHPAIRPHILADARPL
jgi:predicted nucleotidyltransferase